MQEVLNHVHPLEAYSAFIKKIQYSAAYFSQVRFINRGDRSILASYSLTEDTDTVLPSVPHVPAEYVEIVGLAGIIDCKFFWLRSMEIRISQKTTIQLVLLL